MDLFCHFFNSLRKIPSGMNNLDPKGYRLRHFYIFGIGKWNWISPSNRKIISALLMRQFQDSCTYTFNIIYIYTLTKHNSFNKTVFFCCFVWKAPRHFIITVLFFLVLRLRHPLKGLKWAEHDFVLLQSFLGNVYPANIWSQAWLGWSWTSECNSRKFCFHQSVTKSKVIQTILPNI